MDGEKTLKLMTTREHHAALKEAAKRENVSLNTYILYQLAMFAGEENGKEAKRKKHEKRVLTEGFEQFEKENAGLE